MDKYQLKVLIDLLELFRNAYKLDPMMDNVYIAYLLKEIKRKLEEAI